MTEEQVKAIATIVVTAGVNIANVMGYALDVETWVSAVLSIVSAGCIVIAWWRNNNVTPEAAQAQAVLDHLKAEKAAKKAD